MNALNFLQRRFLKKGGFFVSGTDTGIGKTYVSCLLAGELRGLGLEVGVMKPAESGSNSDARKLKAASGSKEPLALINPYRFKDPLAPGLAAEREGRSVHLGRIVSCYRLLAKGKDGMLVEGAGGLLVPLSGPKLVADLASRLGLPLLLVARAGLGTINHSLLSLAEARRRGLKVAAVLLNGKSLRKDLSRQGNAAAIARYGKVPVIGPLSWGSKSLKNADLRLP
jgi:dethiobiotin synthetase